MQMLLWRLGYFFSRIPPTALVDGSYSAYKTTGITAVPNPTNTVGGWFILGLQNDWHHGRPESHQRSWWMVHTRPTKQLASRPSRIPPTQLVDGSYSAY